MSRQIDTVEAFIDYFTDFSEMRCHVTTSGRGNELYDFRLSRFIQALMGVTCSKRAKYV